MQVTEEEFARQVRDALAILYDPVGLNSQPLIQTLSDSRDSEAGVSDAATLRERLMLAMDRLQPGPQIDPNSRAWRPYRVLQLRYVEGLDATEVQRRLALSKSQYYRELESALSAVAAILREQASPGGLSVGPPAMNEVAGASRTVAARPSWRWRAVAGGILAVVVALAVLLLTRKGSPPTTSAKAGTGGRDVTNTLPASASVLLSVYAGSGQPGHENGAAAQARFSGLFGLGLGKDGTLYVADTGNHRIRKISTSGLVLDLAGSGAAGYVDGPSATAQFSSPNAVTVGSDGTVYVGDAGNFRIRAITPAGAVTTLAGSGVAGYKDGVGTEAAFTTTGALVADSAGNLYVPDPRNNVVRKVTPAGAVTTFAGSGTRGHSDGPAKVAQFNNPQRMGCVDGADNVYVLDTGDSRVRKVSPQGDVSTVAGTGVFGYADGPVAQALFSDNILGVCTDAAGNVYIMDAGNRRVRRVSRDGIASTLFEFTDPGQNPGNLKLDQGGNIYLSDREHNVIYKLAVRGGR